ncbi:MAG: surface-adhesin E family protein [Caulobacterales bacterium]
MAVPASTGLILALACAGLACAPAARASVYAVVRSEPGVVTVMDPAAIELVAGAPQLRSASSVSVQRNLVSGGPQQPGYVRTLNEYDCAVRKVRWKSFFVYSRFGAPIMHKDNDDGAWNAAAPGSQAEAELRLVCDHSNRWSAIASQSISHLVITLMQAWDAEAPLPALQAVRARPKASAAKRRDKPAARR